MKNQSTRIKISCMLEGNFTSEEIEKLLEIKFTPSKLNLNYESYQYKCLSFKIEEQSAEIAIEQLINKLHKNRNLLKSSGVENINIRIVFFYSYETNWEISADIISKTAKINASLSISTYLQPLQS